MINIKHSLQWRYIGLPTDWLASQTVIMFSRNRRRFVLNQLIPRAAWNILAPRNQLKAVN
jgi:hypothetical protein